MSLQKKSIQSLSKADLQGKNVLVRLDLNVPVDKAGVITDDTRISAALPTIQYLNSRGAKVIIMSHFGRPNGQVVDGLRLTSVAKKLSEIANLEVVKCDQTMGSEVKRTIQNTNGNALICLENTRFELGDEQNDDAFAKSLAELADIFVFDAFGTAHRSHGSTIGVARHLPSFSGLLVEKELAFFHQILTNPQRPLVAIIGGAKISTKIGVLEHLLGHVDTLIIGGGMMFTLLKAQGIEVGKSLVEDDKMDEANSFLRKAQSTKTKVVLAQDVVCTTEFSNDSPAQIVDITAILPDQMGLDIGPKTIKTISDIIDEAKLVIWNGPLGVFEFSNFAKGTLSIATVLANSDAVSVVGGGDSVAALNQTGLETRISHVSTGGGAVLELLEGKALPAIEVLENND